MSGSATSSSGAISIGMSGRIVTGDAPIRALLAEYPTNDGELLDE